MEKKVYVANEGSNSVSVIDTATNTVTTTVNVGSNPVAFGQFIYSIPVKPVLPVANFSSNVTEGYVPLSIQFTNLSTNATEWIWDFGDGFNSTEQNPIHTYSAAGNYTVNFTAINRYGTDSTSAAINVTKKPVFPGCINPPTDPDQDGCYEDISGNGRLDFDDVVKLYNMI